MFHFVWQGKKYIVESLFENEPFLYPGEYLFHTERIVPYFQ